jgi:AcrR family transcriptional regulator
MHQAAPRRRPRGAVRDGLVAAGLELARTGGPDAVVLREATRMVGVVPNAAYRHFADRDELLAAVCTAAMNELADRMAAGVARVPGPYGDPAAARLRLGAIGTAYLDFAREEPGLFATAFVLPQQHPYGPPSQASGPDRTPLGQLRSALDELVDAGVLRRSAATAWSTPSGPRCTGWPCSPTRARCATSRTQPAATSSTSPSASSTAPWPEPAGGAGGAVRCMRP